MKSIGIVRRVRWTVGPGYKLKLGFGMWYFGFQLNMVRYWRVRSGAVYWRRRGLGVESGGLGVERREEAGRAEEGESCRWGLKCENGEIAVVWDGG